MASPVGSGAIAMHRPHENSPPAFWLPHVFGGVYDEHSKAPQTHTSHT